MELLSRARNNSDFWRLILIALVLVILPFSNYSKAASWQPFTSGGAGWEILDSGSAATYRFNGAERLSYNSSIGQWSQKGQLDGGTWSNLGSAGQSSTFIGDGKEYSIGSGWSYMYNGSNSRKQDSSWFSLNGNYRLAYNYTEGQWWQKGIDWSKVGSAGLSTAFIGDGTDRSIGSGWTYMYNGSNARKQDSAWFSLNGNYRLAYNYTEGQWWQKGTDWSKLGSSGISTAFIGDGTIHSIGSGWSYIYNGSNSRNQDSAWFSINGNYRFAHNYSEGQWWQKSVDWSKMGDAGISSAFIGDGWYHSLNSSWKFAYDQSADFAKWSQINGKERFEYLFATAQWYNKGNFGSPEKLGPAGLSSSFLGDGNWHKMDSIWYYKLVSGIGYMTGSVSTWSPGTTGDSGTWGSFPTLTCNYTTQTMGLYDSSSTSSVFLYDFNEESSAFSKWTNWNYNISNKSEISAATVFYTGLITHDVSSWLGWLPVTPRPQCITRTETWDFRNNDWANRYNHEVRAFWNNVWLVQRAQGDIGNCGILASIDSFEAESGLYVGYTKTWHDTAYAKGWAASSGSTTSSQQASLMQYMGQQFNSPVSADYGTNLTKSLTNLSSDVLNGYKVVIDIDLHYISEFGSLPLNSYHAVGLTGSSYSINGVGYTGITNGWNIQNNTTKITGFDPKSAYPITHIPWSELQNAYFSYTRIQ